MVDSLRSYGAPPIGSGESIQLRGNFQEESEATKPSPGKSGTGSASTIPASVRQACSGGRVLVFRAVEPYDAQTKGPIPGFRIV
jgi:hypothetical protein